jgi:hypothetical protein
MGMKTTVVLNDEAHHCYRERVQDAEGETEADLKGEEKDEAKENNVSPRTRSAPEAFPVGIMLGGSERFSG